MTSSFSSLAATLLDLPEECLANIFEYLNWADRLSMNETSVIFRQAMHHPTLWKTVYFEDFLSKRKDFYWAMEHAKFAKHIYFDVIPTNNVITIEEMHMYLKQSLNVTKLFLSDNNLLYSAQFFSYMDNLLIVDLRRCTNIESNSLSQFLPCCKLIKSLDLRRCRQLTASNLTSIASQLPDLVEFRCEDSSELHVKDVISILSSCPLIRRMGFTPEQNACDLSAWENVLRSYRRHVEFSYALTGLFEDYPNNFVVCNNDGYDSP